MTKHPHHDLIVKWANGAIIQFYSDIIHGWIDCDENGPRWRTSMHYRVKPPEDIVMERELILIEPEIGVPYLSWKPNPSSNIILTFDGETKKLKSVALKGN